MHSANIFAECLAYERALYIYYYYFSSPSPSLPDHTLAQTSALTLRPTLRGLAQSLSLSIREDPNTSLKEARKLSLVSLSHKGHFVFPNTVSPLWPNTHSSPAVFIHRVPWASISLMSVSPSLHDSDGCQEALCHCPKISNVLPNKHPGPESPFIVRDRCIYSRCWAAGKSAVQNQKRKNISLHHSVLCMISIKVPRPTK